MTKGIAVQTILMLLVGIIVVGILVYMVYRYFMGAPLSEQDCRARVIAWCNGCRVMNFTQSGIQVTSEMADCASTYFGSTLSAGDSCNTDANSNYQFCRAF